MIDSSKCVNCDGKTYCWDTDKKQVVEVIAKPTDIKIVPVKALQMLMELLDERSVK